MISLEKQVTEITIYSFFSEPGYYHEGEFGIRLENIVRVVKSETKFNFGNRGYLTFEDVTLVPIQTSMIIPDMLSPVEVLHQLTFMYTK